MIEHYLISLTLAAIFMIPAYTYGYLIGKRNGTPEEVYVLEGWFGDAEWREGIYLRKKDADREWARLRKVRITERAPDFVNERKLARFAVETVEVIQ